MKKIILLVILLTSNALTPTTKKINFDQNATYNQNLKQFKQEHPEKRFPYIRNSSRSYTHSNQEPLVASEIIARYKRNITADKVKLINNHPMSASDLKYKTALIAALQRR